MLSSKPRCFRSVIRAAVGWSTCGQTFRSPGVRSLWWSQGIVPLADRRRDLHVAHARFDEAAGHQAAHAEVGRRRIVEAVQAAGRPCFVREVEQLLGMELHAGGQLVALDAGLEFGIDRIELAAFFVEVGQQCEVVPLDLARQRISRGAD